MRFPTSQRDRPRRHVLFIAIVSARAGLMIYIPTDEIIPTSCAGGSHQTIFSLPAGIVSVILLGMI